MAKEQNISVWKEKLLNELEEVAATIVNINSNLDDLTSMVEEDGNLAETIAHMNFSLEQLMTTFHKIPMLKDFLETQTENNET